MNYLDCSRAEDLVEGKVYQLAIDQGGEAAQLSFRFDPGGRIAGSSEVILRSREKLDVLKRLGAFPGMVELLGQAVLDFPYEDLERRLKADVYIFGAHQVGVLLARLYVARGGRVCAFLDNDPAKQGSQIDGIPVRKLDRSRMSEDVLIVLGSGRYSVEIEQVLHAEGWSNTFTMQQFLAAMDTPYITESSFRNYRSTVVQQRASFISAFLCLDDERSRQVFDGLIRQRLGFGHAAPEIRSAFMDEYLDKDFISSSDVMHYVDAGAYNGDTLARLESRLGTVGSACLFEPEFRAYQECLHRFQGRSEVTVLQAAMTEHPGQLASPTSNSCDVLGVLSTEPQSATPSHVPGLPLDEVATLPVTLIKLDIEGGEEGALKGARQIIQRDRPKLCVCAYHRSDDLWKLIDTVLSMRDDYKVGVRHYSDIVDDTTLYFY
ncbi:FkbM family methyltransferase [Pseudomonas guariconensis]|uniref:FkbM family methyltransferase n=1 Tax=Pseudomonas guariconensis TaxID=1288410 RepID=UPI0018D7945F|nr:FkbM family methyltransferase [Pseudomonas guariconensis]MBH3359489.1 FkbM family methyltransferase [Pseudomonas guariconensis]